jgi:hypothetical protein
METLSLDFAAFTGARAHVWAASRSRPRLPTPKRRSRNAAPAGDLSEVASMSGVLIKKAG